VEKRLLLDGITLDGVHVAVRRIQRALAVESDFAYTREVRANWAAMSAREAAQAAFVDSLEQFRWSGKLGELVSQGLQCLDFLTPF
jgi:hypothetical protein